MQPVAPIARNFIFRNPTLWVGCGYKCLELRVVVPRILSSSMKWWSTRQIFTPLQSPGISLKPQWRQNWFAWVILVATGLWIVATVLYALAVSRTDGILHQFIPISHGPTVTVRILRVLSEGIAILLIALINSTLDAVLWAAASSKAGVSMSTILSLSRSTELFGLLELLFLWRKPKSGRDFHTLVSIIR